MSKIGKAVFDLPEDFDLEQELADILREEIATEIEKKGSKTWAEIIEENKST